MGIIHLKFLDIVDVTDNFKKEICPGLYGDINHIALQNDVWDVHIFVLTENKDGTFSVDMINHGKDSKVQKHFKTQDLIESIEDMDFWQCEEYPSREKAMDGIYEW